VDGCGNGDEKIYEQNINIWNKISLSIVDRFSKTGDTISPKINIFYKYTYERGLSHVEL
jgi:hypothetical protein